MKKSIRILIAEGHTLFRESLQLLIDNEKDFRVVGTARDGKEALDGARELKPDVLLLDLALPAAPVMEVLRRLLDQRLEVRPLLMTTSIDNAQLVQALKLGARGILQKDTTPEFLFRSIRSVRSGEYWVGNQGIASLVSFLRSAPTAEPSDGELSERERQIIESVIAGLTNREIAKKLAVSEDTVKHHLTRIYAKTGVKNRLKLGLWAGQKLKLQ
jgi:two-component system, NarL family, nitrate/nitrite response regulator NarL